jgi:hypothetical protein
MTFEVISGVSADRYPQKTYGVSMDASCDKARLLARSITADSVFPRGLRTPVQFPENPAARRYSTLHARTVACRNRVPAPSPAIATQADWRFRDHRNGPSHASRSPDESAPDKPDVSSAGTGNLSTTTQA